MEEWKEYSLGDITDLVIDYRGKTPLKLGSDWSDSGYRALSAKNIKTGQIVAHDSIRFVDEALYHKWMKDEVKRGDILITSEAPFGQVFYWDSDEKIVLSQRLFCVRINADYDSRYVYYYMTTSRFQSEMSSRASGTTVLGLRQPELLKCNITVPSLETQRHIASILSSLDDKIVVNKKICENLEAQAQALFKHWFIDFAPFKDGKFVESELGLIPEGWRVGKFGKDVIEIKSGGTPKTDVAEYWKNGTIPFFSPKDVSDTVYCFSTEKSITEAGLNKCNSQLYPKNTVFITARGTVGKVVLASRDMAMNQSNYALIGKVGYDQLYVFFQTRFLVERLKKKANGAVFSAITTTDFNENVVIPPFSIIKEFVSVAKPLIEGIFNNGEESSRLASLRDTLLPKLMSGQIKVNEIEKSL